MPKPFLILALALILAMASLPAQAQTDGVLPPAQDDLVHFASEYTKMVTFGIVSGGVLMNLLVGGGGATLAGALAGSSLASWLFVSLQARHYIIQRTGSHPAH